MYLGVLVGRPLQCDERRGHNSESRPLRRIFSSVRTAKTAILWIVALGAGIATGLWMASMSYYSEFGLVAPPRFATWQCCIAGFAVSAVGFGIVVALNRAFVSTSFGGVRRVSRYLFEDLAQRQRN